jgi:uncharacterized membrane protein HdeD (DUF308 family)
MSTSPAPHSLGAGLSGPRRAGSPSAALLIALGAVEIALGLIAIVWPAVASVSIAILLGCLFLVEGGVALVGAFTARGWLLLGRLVWSFVSGLAGIYLIAYPEGGVVGLTVLLVIVLFLAGVSLLGTGLLGDENRGLLIAAGVLNIVLGALIWADLPSSASWAIGLLVGLHFLVGGLRTTSSGLELRREKRGPRIREEALSRA